MASKNLEISFSVWNSNDSALGLKKLITKPYHVKLLAVSVSQAQKL